MKISDLAIGDYVRVVKGSNKGRIVQVLGISMTHWLTFYEEEDYGPVHVLIDWVEPIELNPGTLIEVFHFTPAQDITVVVNAALRARKCRVWTLEDSVHDTIMTIYEIANGYAVNLDHGMTLGFQYVHELQHLLRLTGSKEITFKK